MWWDEVIIVIKKGKEGGGEKTIKGKEKQGKKEGVGWWVMIGDEIGISVMKCTDGGSLTDEMK